MFFQMLIEWSDTPCLSLELREGGDSKNVPSMSLVCSSHSQICQGPLELARGQRRVLEVGRERIWYPTCPFPRMTSTCR